MQDVCIYPCVCVSVYSWCHIYVALRVCMHDVCLYVLRVHVCTMCLYMSLCVHMSMYMYVHVCLYVCTHVHTLYINMYTNNLEALIQ